MAQEARIVELLLEDFKTVKKTSKRVSNRQASVSSVAYELEISAPDAAKIVENYGRERSGFTLVYSVCYRDSQGNTVVSHVPENKLQELVANFGYVNFQLAAIHDSLLVFESMSHADFKRELETVHRKLTDAQIRNDLYVPSYSSIKANGLELRKFDVTQRTIPKVETPKPTVSSASETRTPERKIVSRPATTSRLTMDSFATSKQSLVGTNRSDGNFRAHEFQGASSRQGVHESQRIQGGALKTPKNSGIGSNVVSGAKGSFLGSGGASDSHRPLGQPFTDARVQTGALKTPKSPITATGGASFGVSGVTGNTSDFARRTLTSTKTSPRLSSSTGATVTADTCASGTNQLPSFTSDGGVVSEKRQRVGDAATLSSSSSTGAAATTIATSGNLFDLDDPLVYDDEGSNSLRIAEQPKVVTYVEKRVKQDTYVEDGYFVVEDKDEYVAVKRKVDSPRPKVGGPKLGVTCKPDKSKQYSITSFFGK